MRRKLTTRAVSLHCFALSLLAADQPNIIMILADDVGLGTRGGTGGPFKTPHLDALAKDGTQFSHCFAIPPSELERAAQGRRATDE